VVEFDDCNEDIPILDRVKNLAIVVPLSLNVETIIPTSK